MWVVKRITLHNFRSYADATWDLTAYPGVTLLRAKNGGGKTTWFNAIVYALWGELPPRVPVDKVIRRGADECRVEVIIEVDGKEYIIERGRTARSPSFHVTGFDRRATVHGMQRAVNSLVGECETFLLTRMFTGAMSSFCRLPDAQRKALLEKMLHIDTYARAAEAAKQALKTAEVEADALSRNKIVTEQQLTSMRERQQQVNLDTFMYALRCHREYYKRLHAFQDACEVLWEKREAVHAWYARQAEYQQAVEKKRNQCSVMVAGLEASLENLTKQLEPLQAQLTTIDVKIQDIRKYLQQVESDIHPEMCPTCGQRWPQESESASIGAAIDAAKERRAELMQSRVPVDAQMKALRGEIEDVKKDLRIARIELQAIATNANEKEYLQVTRDVAEARADALNAQRLLTEYAESHDPENPPEPPQTDLQGIEDAMQACIQDLQRNAEYQDRLKFWRKGYGPGGIPSFLLDSAIPTLNRSAGKIADALTNGDLSVTFDAAATKGNSSVFNVNVSYATGGEQFECVSRGEQTRVDLAVLLAVADLSAASYTTTCTQLFFDEITDGTDAAFGETFVAMLRQYYKGKQAFIISHDPSMVNVVDRVIEIRKKNGLSYMKSS